MNKSFFLVSISIIIFSAACNFKNETTYTNKYRYFLTKRDKVNDSLVKELCGSTWQLFHFENRTFNKQKMLINDSREYLNSENVFAIKFNADSSITTINPTQKGSWSINNQYFIEFDFFGNDTSNHLIGKYDVKLRGDDLIFNKGMYTSDTSSETVRFHFFRNGNEIKLMN